MASRQKLAKYILTGLAVALLLAAQTLSIRYYLTIRVTINKSPVAISKGTTLRQLLKVRGVYLEPGDLVDTDGRLLRKGKGNPPVLKVNGQPANLSYKLKDGDRIVAKPGKDLHDKIVEKLDTMLPPYKIVGGGAFVNVSKRGKPGVKVVRVGSKSGIVFSEVVRENPVGESVIRKYDKGALPVVALTFDDGPHPNYTPQILSILQERGARATFFVIGRQADKYSYLLKQIVQAGCVIGNHTYSHACLSKLNYNQMMSELDEVDKVIMRETGENTYWIRPPGGFLSPLLVDTAVGSNQQVVMWSVDSHDWRNRNPTAISQTVLSRVRPGAVILFHDGGGNRAGTVAALPGIIDSLRAGGYQFVLLDQIR